MSTPQDSAVSMNCGALAAQIQKPIARHLPTVAILLLLSIFVLYVSDTPHTAAYAWIAVGIFIPLAAWCRLRHPGLPLIGLLSLQTLAVFATPIITRNPTLASYSTADLSGAGFEIFIFCVALVFGWRMAFSTDHSPGKPRHYHTLAVIDPNRPETLCKAGLVLLALGAAYQFAFVTGWLDAVKLIIPGGIFSVIRTLFEAAALAGCLVGAYAAGTGAMPRGQQSTFWLLLIAYFLLRCSTILLSSVAGVVTATSVGYFLGARRPPWLFLTLVIAALAFLNLSKFEMRAKYWNESGFSPGVAALDMPGYFAEWGVYSFNIITFNRTISVEDEATGQRLTDRLDNLQNLLFAQSAIKHRNLPLLGGDTYLIIPKLLIPRLFWPEKPTSHEGQIMLNVHFGRQTLEATKGTFVAWGLLAEAYGNFGSIWGPLVCGALLGLSIGALERWIRPYPITSLQSFFFLIIAVNFSLSFEMVASVWVTSVFQMVIAVLVSLMPIAKLRRFKTASAA